jgi:hypothetical protein
MHGEANLFTVKFTALLSTIREEEGALRRYSEKKGIHATVEERTSYFLLSFILSFFRIASRELGRE